MRAVRSPSPSGRRTSAASAPSRATSPGSTSSRRPKLPSLLLEIGCEELPAAACQDAERQLPELCERALGAAPAAVYVGPRRLAVLVRDLPGRTPDEWIKGPPVDLRERAAEGFARKQGVKADELEERDGFLGVT